MDATQQQMLRELMALDFSIIDMQLYLDTHPNDQRAIMYFNSLVQRASVLRQTYQQKYGPLMVNTTTSSCPWQWIKDPWPWEKQ